MKENKPYFLNVFYDVHRCVACMCVFYVHRCGACMCVCAPWTHLAHLEARKGDRSLELELRMIAMLVLGIKPGSS